MGKFIVIVLDGYGIGAMDDVSEVRAQDIGANTSKHIFDALPDLKLPNLEKLGLMNALDMETNCMKKSPKANYGSAALAHFGADTFNGHHEIMGTKPKEPLIQPFQECIDEVDNVLKSEGYTVENRGDKLKYLLVNGVVTVADNIEADPGQIYNLTAALDLIPYSEVLKIGRVVRKAVKVSRVIPFGGTGVSIEQILNAAEEKEGRFIGINAPKSGVYNQGYQVLHLGYGIDPNVQAPTILGRHGIPVTLLGKVADIVENLNGKSISCVDTEEVMKLTLKEVEDMKEGFICTNVQETDLAGHGENVERYAEKLRIADRYIGYIVDKLEVEDILIIMADHGNDPSIGHSHHTRENVPLLICKKEFEGKYIGHRNTLSDVGASVLEYFNLRGVENGLSFMDRLLKN